MEFAISIFINEKYIDQEYVTINDVPKIKLWERPSDRILTLSRLSGGT